jgi:hypothetical protein
MAKYFVLPADRSLILPAALQAHASLPAISGETEYDIIEKFTGNLRTTLYVGSPSLLLNGDAVFLAGYREDAADADPKFARALKYTVADVTSWRLQALNRDRAVATGMSMDRTQLIKYRADANAPYPANWQHRLRKYILIEDTYIV